MFISLVLLRKSWAYVIAILQLISFYPFRHQSTFLWTSLILALFILNNNTSSICKFTRPIITIKSISRTCWLRGRHCYITHVWCTPLRYKQLGLYIYASGKTKMRFLLSSLYCGVVHKCWCSSFWGSISKFTCAVLFAGHFVSSCLVHCLHWLACFLTLHRAYLTLFCLF